MQAGLEAPLCGARFRAGGTCSLGQVEEHLGGEPPFVSPISARPKWGRTANSAMAQAVRSGPPKLATSSFKPGPMVELSDTFLM